MTTEPNSHADTPAQPPVSTPLPPSNPNNTPQQRKRRKALMLLAGVAVLALARRPRSAAFKGLTVQ